ncbi:MAG: glycosyltransferase family 2 protein [Candidatus Pacebacteria bacterium]|nr:glycosyltransferase family 2 protein [Candidatus Paceibacterota bacterium]
MASFGEGIFYIFSFLSLYVQVFFIITYIEKRKEIFIRKDKIELANYPTVTIIVPCYNESRTVEKTILSLLALDYPTESLKLVLVDDGSTDNTREVLESYKGNPMITVLSKKNGGKHTAMNLGLEHTNSEFVGGLDADSFVHPEALKRIISYFDDKKTMAVSSAVVVHEPKNILQKAQKVEYHFGVFMKKMLGTIGGIHVAPGPFTIFRKRVFDDLGPYRKAHNTEDAEIALRMQKNGYKIDHCPDGYVYTVTPNTIPKLYRQRVRWIYGFLKNAKDYRGLFFNKKYGNIGFFTLPAGILSVFAIIYVFASTAYHLAVYLSNTFTRISATGFSSTFKISSFNWFFLNTETITFLAILLTVLLIISLLLGQKMVEGKMRPSFHMVYFFILSSVLAPIWLTKALYNAVFAKESSWTDERPAFINKV